MVQTRVVKVGETQWEAFSHTLAVEHVDFSVGWKWNNTSEIFLPASSPARYAPRRKAGARYHSGLHRSLKALDNDIHQI
jgi:hypothetical protein